MKNLERNVNYEEIKLNLIGNILHLDCKKWKGNYILHKSKDDMFMAYFKSLDFDDILPAPDKRTAAQLYIDLGLELTDQFFVEFSEFNNLINDHYKYRYCKFYLLDDNGLNLGLSFSKKNIITIDPINDKLFKLIGERFVAEDFSLKKDEFIKPGGIRDNIKNIIPSVEVTEMIQFELAIVRDYNERISHSFTIEKLKFTMLKFPPDYEDKYGKKDKKDRISFSVKPFTKGINDDLIHDFDAGDLKP